MKNNNIIIDYSQIKLNGIDTIEDKDLKISILRKRVIDQQIKINKTKQELAECSKSIKSKDFLKDLEFFSQNSLDSKFYSSNLWLKVRFEALINNGKKCCLCGSENNLHVDHIKPRYLRPDLALKISNLQILCKQCNFGKGTRSVIIRRSKK